MRFYQSDTIAATDTQRTQLATKKHRREEELLTRSAPDREWLARYAARRPGEEAVAIDTSRQQLIERQRSYLRLSRNGNSIEIGNGTYVRRTESVAVEETRVVRDIVVSVPDDLPQLPILKPFDLLRTTGVVTPNRHSGEQYSRSLVHCESCGWRGWMTT